MTITISSTDGTNTISFIVGTLTTPFASEAFPRERPQMREYGRSISGTLNRTGAYYDAPHIWNLEFRCKREDREKFDRLYTLWMSNPGWVLVADEIQKISELVQTRGKVTGTDIVTIDGQKEYFAQFYAYFSAPPTYQAGGAYSTVSCQLTEVDVKVAP